jgi:cytidyltransferase-like protein
MFRHALIAGKFAPFHRGHQHLVETALAESERLTVLAYANPDFPAMPGHVRAGWIRALYPMAQVLVPNDPPPDASPDAVHRRFVRDLLDARGLQVDAVFSSEDYGPGFAATLGAAHRMVDRDRLRVPVSGRLIRADLAAHRAFLHPIVLRDLAGSG